MPRHTYHSGERRASGRYTRNYGSSHSSSVDVGSSGRYGSGWYITSGSSNSASYNRPSRSSFNVLLRNFYSTGSGSGGSSGSSYGGSRRRRYYNYTAADVSARLEELAVDDRAPEPHPEKTLQVRSLDLNIESNGAAHHTDEYEASEPSSWPRPALVARRGQPFNMALTFNRHFDPANDDLRIIFKAAMTGSKPMKSKGTHVDILLSDKDELNKWGAKILSNHGTQLTVTVFTPPTLYVGKWNLSIEVVEKDDTASNVYNYIHPAPVYFLFNPWCKDDSVYLDNDQHRKEYILNQSGMIFNGTASKIAYKPWYFGQFDACVLEVALGLLDQGDLKWTVRGNPIPVVRKLTAMVNSSDDDGVLEGNWSGDYGGGRSPLSWTGSVAILQRYLATGPVKYGQCWVFSGVTTTLMRALGIPARSVTNFSSAHDTDGSITIDYHFNGNGEPEDELNEDSIWNFHVWNEVWMSRPDLPKGFGGWQAVDATPQETSDGSYVCGPVSLQAIRQGEVNLPYDAPFVFAEVNADIMHWIVDDHGMTLANLKKQSVGRHISTKACNSRDREDITHQYKPSENSAEERAAVKRANQTGSSSVDVYESTEKDVVFEIEQDAEGTWVGQDFVVGLRIKNAGSKPRTINGRLVVKTMFYTGVTCDKIKTEPLSDAPLVLKPGQETFHKFAVTSDEYLDKLKDGCMLDVTVMAQVTETGQVFATKDNFRLRKPHLTIKAPGYAQAGNQFMVDVTFVNPLDTALTNCCLEVDGLSKDISFPSPNVAAKGTFHASIPVTASKKGQKELIIVFAAKQLEDVNGTHPIFIRAA